MKRAIMALLVTDPAAYTQCAPHSCIRYDGEVRCPNLVHEKSKGLCATCFNHGCTMPSPITCDHTERNPYFDGRYCNICKRNICVTCHAADATVQETFCAMCAPPVPEDAGHEWPLRDVLARLADFADDRLTRGDYDGHGHESLRTCVTRARELLAARARTVAPREPDNSKRVACNRHRDCADATNAYKVDHYGELPPSNFHCYDETCEDCFGS